MSGPAGETCETCRFYDLPPGVTDKNRDLIYGLCHRNPPDMDKMGFTTWPKTKTYDWCGEWRGVDE